MNKLFIIANWKMNPQTSKEAEALFSALRKGLKRSKHAEVVLSPPFVYLQGIRTAKGARGIMLGAQDCFWEEKGAYTGEISPRMLRNLGCSYVIIGHSERELNLRETQAMANKKIKAALKAGLKVVFCVGEREEERDQIGRALREEISQGLAGLDERKLNNIIIAYEPVWAIGTGNPCEPHDALEAKLFIKRVLIETFGKRRGDAIPVLYGGSVTSRIAVRYIHEAGMQGLLVGGASLNSKEFTKIVKSLVP